MKKVHQKSCDILFLWKNLHHVLLAFAHNQLCMIPSYYQNPIINPNHTVATTTSYPSVIGSIKVVHGMSCMIQFVCLLFGFKISSYKSEEIEFILSFKDRTIQILMQKLLRFLNLHVQISQIKRKPNESHTNRIIEMVPCKTYHWFAIFAIDKCFFRGFNQKMVFLF